MNMRGAAGGAAPRPAGRMQYSRSSCRSLQNLGEETNPVPPEPEHRHSRRRQLPPGRM